MADSPVPLACVNGGGYSGLFAPSTLEPFPYKSSVTSEFFAPVCGNEGFSIAGYDNIVSLVPNLIFSRCPPAIFSRVSGVVVESFETVVRAWSRPKVIIEILERLKPPIAHRYPSSTISRKAGGIRVCASLSHVAPDRVFTGVPHSVSSSGRSVSDDFFKEASTRLCLALVKSTSPYFNLFAAITPAKPRHISVATRSESVITSLDYVEPAKPFAGQILKDCHFVTSKLLTVKKAWQSAVRQIFGSYPSQVGAFYHV